MNKRLLVILCFSFYVCASAQVSLNLMLRQPTPPQLSDWQRDPSIVQLMVSNIGKGRYKNATFSIKIYSGKGSLAASTKDNDPSMPRFDIPPGPPSGTGVLLINGSQLINFGAVEINKKIETTALSTNSLPEGDYQICITAFDESGNNITNGGEYCRSFNILLPDPPTLLSPMNDSDVQNKFPHFVWSPVIGASPLANIKYKLKIVPIFTGQNSQFAMDSNPALLEKITPATNYIYLPADQPFTFYPDAKGFAWQVQAIDNNGEPATRLKGKSEIFTFQFKQVQFLYTAFPPTLNTPDDKEQISTNTPTFSWNYSGHNDNLKYKLVVCKAGFYKNAQHVINTSPPVYEKTYNAVPQLFGPAPPIQFENGQKYLWQVLVINKKDNTIKTKSDINEFLYKSSITALNILTSSCNGNLKYQYAYPGFGEAGEYVGYPLANANIKLVVKYVLKATSHVNQGTVNKSIALKAGTIGTQGFTDMDKVLGTTKTDPDGNFTFNFIYNDSTGVIVQRNFHYGKDSGENQDYYTGDVYRYLRVVLQYPHATYHTSPSADITVQPGENKNIGNKYAYVRSYLMNVTVKPDDKWQNQYSLLPLDNMIVYILRGVRPFAVPENEGHPHFDTSGTMFGLEVIAKSVTGDFGPTLGKVKFRRLVKSTGTPFDRYYIYAVSDPTKGSNNYRMNMPLPFEYTFPEDNAVYSNEYDYPVVNKDVVVTPLLPKILGRVVRADGGQGAVLAKVELLNYALFFWANEANRNTGVDGSFAAFENLPVQFDQNGNINAPIRALRISKYGFKSKNILVEGKGIDGSLVFGEKKNYPEITLEPESKITGKIIAETGHGISAMVTVLAGESKEALAPMIIDPNTGKRWPAEFEIRAPKGYTHLVVDPTPFNSDFFPDTLHFLISETSKNLGTIILKRKMHRLRLVVEGATPPSGIGVVQKHNLKGAIVRIEGKTGTFIAEKTTNSSGVVEFEFLNTENEFNVFIKGPLDRDYVPDVKSYYIPETKGWTTKNTYILQAARISGHVYVGTTNQPIKDARVYVDNSSQVPIEAYTNVDGFYTLRNVPIKNSQLIKAVKSASNFVGDSKRANVPVQGLTDFNLNLKVYSDMDISHLMGFPIEVTNLTEISGDVRITGQVVKLDSLSNQIFSSKTETLKFNKIKIQPGNETTIIFDEEVPVSVPSSLPLITDENTMYLNVLGNYNAVLKDNNISIDRHNTQSESGVILGRVMVGADNFQVASSTINFADDGFYIKAPNVTGLKIHVITASKSDPLDLGSGLEVCNESGGEINFELYNFDADANSATLMADSLVINTSLHTNITNMQPADLNLALGNIALTKTSLKPIVNRTNPLSFNLDMWEVTAQQWSLNGYINILEGTLKTDLVDIPIDQMYITPTNITGSKFDFQSMLVSGVIPISIDGDPVFNYDNTKNEWYLFVSKGTLPSAAHFENLPGMQPGSKILIDAMRLTSKGNKTFGAVFGQPEIRIHKVGILRPNTVEAMQSSVDISGLTFNIPKFSQATSIRYGKGSSSQIQLMLMPLQINLAANGVQMQFGITPNEQLNQTLDQTGFKAKGKVFEQGQLEPLVSWLHHTVDSTSIWVETNPVQTVAIGGASTYMNNVTGSMKVVGNDWDYFSFAGDLTGTKGITDDLRRLNFTVKGEIEANNQQLSVKNVPFPFGNMKWTYDFPSQRMIGTLDIDQDMHGVKFKGQAESIIDSKGWYFFAGGVATVPGLGPANAAVIFGDYPEMTSSVRQKFSSASYNKNLPASFETSISGFLISGAMQIPLIIPNIEENLVIVYVKLGINAGGDMRLWSSFNDSGNEYGIGTISFLHAYFTMKSLTCTSLSADARLELGYSGSYQTSNNTFNLDGCGGFNLGAHLKQEFYGCDLDGCGCRYTIFDEGFNFSYKALLHLDSGGGKSLKIETGTCSGN